jgi:O-antigen ligase
MNPPSPTLPRAALAAATAAAPVLLAYNVAPSASAFNQMLAVALWGAWAMAVALAAPPAADRPVPANAARRHAGPLAAALALLALAVLGSRTWGTLPGPLALQALGFLAAAAVLVAAGLRAARADAPAAPAAPSAPAAPAAPASGPARSTGPGWLLAFAWGWLLAGLASLVPALVQVFAPQLADSVWIARTGFPGVAVGNLRQHNQLGSVLMLALVALAVLDIDRLSRATPAPGAGSGPRLGGSWAVGLAAAALVGGLVLTTSRTALVALLLLAAWALLDRRMPGPTRRLLALLPLLYALLWALMVWVTAQGHTEFQGAERFTQEDMSTGRFTVWRETLQLIAADPWAGAGWGRFNLAWTLTPLPGRIPGWFDHPHNLGLHFAAELGVPAALLLLGLLALALWRALAPAWTSATPAPAYGAGRLAGLFVLVLVPHTMLEFPLWFAYFLLPVAWAWGYALGWSMPAAAAAGAAAAPGTTAGVTAGITDGVTASAAAAAWAAPERRTTRHAPLAAAGALLVAGAGAAWADFQPVADVFRTEPGAAPLAQRIERARGSLLFGHHGDYAAATTGIGLGAGERADAAFTGAAHLLLDGRLIAAWAQHLHASGRPALAAGMAARLLEFRGQPQAEALRERCAAARATAAGTAVTTTPAPAADPGPCPDGAPAPPWRAYLAP